jgi:hypothetical protein
MGTPKTLRSAIFNAFEEMNIKITSDMLETIELHVKDYIAQKFTIAHLSADMTPGDLLTKLYTELTQREIK